MRIIAVAAVAAIACLCSAPAGAQNYQFSSVTTAARDVYSACVSLSRREGLSEPRAACACFTGFMGGTMSDRDFEIASGLIKVGELTENGAPQTAIDQEVAAFLGRGFSEADINRVVSMIDEAGARGDAICGQFEREGSA